MPLATPAKPSLELPLLKRKRRPWLLLTAQTIGSIVVCVFALEMTFTICGVGGQEFLQPDDRIGCRHIPGKQVTWRMEGFSNDRLSSTGLRDIEHAIVKRPGVTRIALLGDSSTEGMQVPLPETYARVLER